MITELRGLSQRTVVIALVVVVMLASLLLVVGTDRVGYAFRHGLLPVPTDGPSRFTGR